MDRLVFELWSFSDHVSRCFARRTQDQVGRAFHNMRPGDSRVLSRTTTPQGIKIHEIFCTGWETVDQEES